jgi:hypothetical protein
MSSYQVRFWAIQKLPGKTRTRYRVRWNTGGREHCKSFATRALADAFLTTLKDAARHGTPFDPVSGQPAPATPARPDAVTWYDHARAYSQMKWPDLAAKSRRSVAEALTTITLALTGNLPEQLDPALLRQALLCYAFNHASTSRRVPAKITRALGWTAKASPPLAVLDDPDTVRAVLAACARRLDGRPAAAATARRKRAVLASALGYAVERHLLPVSPLTRVRWKPGEVAQTVDRRSMASPAQADRPAARSGPRPGITGRAHGGVLRLSVLCRVAPFRSCRAPRAGPGPARLRVGPHRPGLIRTPRRDLVD